MKLSQKRAIAYAVSKRNRAKQMKFLFENDLHEEFQQSKYKTMLWFLKSKGYTYKDWEKEKK
ncbi:MAG: hypothetical protein IKW45_06485 [Clostridia bacterium]|nr:hypothetical protein [Clostridia bacterium]